MQIIAKVADWNNRTILRLYHGGWLSISNDVEDGIPYIEQFIQLTPLTATMLAKELKKWARAERKRSRKIRSYKSAKRQGWF